jgi:hypothetical protein
MRSYLTYYFAGVTTAGVALLVGFGGALVFSHSVLSKKPVPPKRIEQMAKSQPQNEPLPTKKYFSVEAAPVETAQRLPQPTEMATIDAGASQEPTQVIQPTQSRTPSTPPEFTVTSSMSTAAPHPRQEGTIAVAKRRRQNEPKNVRRAVRADSLRHAANRNREIAAATEAVRRMIRDRQDFPENAMEQSFLGFSSD